MKIEEIRIGNLFEIKPGRAPKGIHPVTALLKYSDGSINGRVWFVNNPKFEECGFPIDQIIPIPITEKWLLDFGFILRDDVNRGFTKTYNSYLNLSFYCCPKDGTTALVDEFIKYKDFILYKIESIHQLQNLFFATTKQELEIK